MARSPRITMKVKAVLLQIMKVKAAIAAIVSVLLRKLKAVPIMIT